MAKDEKQFARTKANKIKRLIKMLKANPDNVIARMHLEKRERS